MRSFVLVLLVAASAIASPYIEVNQADINSVSPLPDNGRPVSSALLNNLFETNDAADASVYANTLEQIVTDMGNQPDQRTKAISVAQALVILGELASGIPGDACGAANAINNYVKYGSAASFKPVLAQYIDILVQAAQNPLSRRYLRGPVGGCPGGGRNYNFEGAWSRILSGASSAASASLLNEDYCTAKRLYNANSVVSNNVAAAATAAAAYADGGYDWQAVAALLRVLAYGGDCAAAGAVAKGAVLA